MGRIQGDLKQRTLAFGEQIIDILPHLPHDRRGWLVAKQLGNSGTSIGANVWEADHALTEADFAHKISIARKESGETEYWLHLSRNRSLLPPEDCTRILEEACELTKILASIVRKTQHHISSA